MGCTKVTVGGVTAIVCTRGRRRCRWCRAAAPYLCDAPAQTGTCDAPICGRCAQVAGPDRHLCPDHTHPDLSDGGEPSPLYGCPWSASSQADDDIPF